MAFHDNKQRKYATNKGNYRKMLLFVACLLPLAIDFVASETPSRNYVLNVDNDVLKKVQFTDNASPYLNLTSMKFRAVEKNAFDDVSNVELLDLSNNLLFELPEFIFSNLTNLRTLSLSSNKLWNLRNLFVGLDSLEVLNISHNPFLHLRRGNFFGLAKNVAIFLDGNKVWSISTDVFANSFLKEAQPIPSLSQIKETHADYNDVQGKLCMSNSIVTSLEIFRKNEELGEECDIIPIDIEGGRVSLKGQKIVAFQKGWYRLQSLPIASLDLSNNGIVEIGRETLNDLPAGLRDVSFLNNKIRKISQGVIENEHLKSLTFGTNLIEEIEHGAFNKTQLTGLYLSSNQLRDLNFVSTLPCNLTDLVLGHNYLTSVPDGAFSNLSRLRHMILARNRIQVLGNYAFRGLTSLHTLLLATNNITTVEPFAFKDLTALEMLDLSNNFIGDLQMHVFTELKKLKRLMLEGNRITEAAFAGLPESLDELYLDFNYIETLEQGSFVRSPKRTLSLSRNNISRIARGAFDLPTLKELDLNNNNLTSIDGDSYEGLSHLRQLSLWGNKISEIRKGSCKNLGSLYVLDVAKNPFQKLEQGAFYGLNTARGTNLYVYENNLKQIQADLFEDI